MAIRNVVTRGYGAGATIAFVVTRGYSIGEEVIVVPLVPDTHTLRFSSVSRSVRFSSVQRQFKFSSASRTLKITDTPDPLGFILTEDGDIIAQENDVPIAQE